MDLFFFSGPRDFRGPGAGSSGGRCRGNFVAAGPETETRAAERPLPIRALAGGVQASRLEWLESQPYLWKFTNMLVHFLWAP